MGVVVAVVCVSGIISAPRTALVRRTIESDVDIEASIHRHYNSTIQSQEHIGADTTGAAEKCPDTRGTTGAKPYDPSSFPSLPWVQFQHFFLKQK